VVKTVILVDESDREIGTGDRELTHREGRLHRAVSVFVINRRGELLLQRRAPTKALFGGMWANTCCTHPLAGETITGAGERRLQEEMGLELSLEVVGSFIYRAEDEATGYIEHELDHVLIGRSDADPVLDPDETDAFVWADLDQLRLVAATDSRYVPWLHPALVAFPDLGHTGEGT
jgi:isopentenyl-diphosphate delta-isomerase